MYQVYTLYTLNLHNVLCQLYQLKKNPEFEEGLSVWDRCLIIFAFVSENKNKIWGF